MYKLLSALCLTVICLQASSQPVDAYVNEWGNIFMQNRQHVGLSIGIVQNGVQHTYHYGSTRKNRYAHPTDSTIYEIGSVTKTFTGFLLAHAILERKVFLLDDIRRYLDTPYTKWISNATPVRIMHLANHTSGLPKNVPAFKDGQTPAQIVDDFKGFTERDFLHQLAQVKTSSAPGAQYAYSNAGVQLLGVILQKIYNQPYAALLEQYITGPLGMRDTRLTIAPADTVRVAKGYDSAGNIMPQADMWKAIPEAGYLKSTTADMLKYLQANLDAQNDTIQLAQQVTLVKTDEGGDAIGLYWFVHQQPGAYNYVSHAGGTFGCTSYCLLVPKYNIGIVCLVNDAAPATEKALKKLAQNIAGMLVRKAGVLQ